LEGSTTDLVRPIFKTNTSAQGVIVENPAFISHINQGYQAYGVYGLFRIADTIIVTDGFYNASGVVRAVTYDHAVPAEG
jgi:hypothetical protein